MNTRWRREWSEFCPHVCSLKWAAPRCISITPRAGGSTWTGCASSMGVMMASHYTTNSRAPRHPVYCSSKWKMKCLLACIFVSKVWRVSGKQLGGSEGEGRISQGVQKHYGGIAGVYQTKKSPWNICTGMIEGEYVAASWWNTLTRKAVQELLPKIK